MGKSYNLEFEIINADAVAQAISQVPGTVRQVAGNRVSLLAEQLKKAIIEETPKDTGTLARSTELQKKSGLKYQIVQTATAKGRSVEGYHYGRGVRHGAKPPGRSGVVGPRKKQALYWDNILNGKPVAVVKNHPGIKGTAITPYVDNALKKSQGQIEATKQQIAVEVTQKAARGFRTGKA